MEPVPPVPPIPPAPPVPAPPPPLPPAPPPMPPAAPPPTEYGAGGFFKQFDWVEIGFMIIGVFTMFTMIDYYRKRAKAEEKNQATIPQIENNVADLKREFTGLKKSLTARRSTF